MVEPVVVELELRVNGRESGDRTRVLTFGEVMFCPLNYLPVGTEGVEPSNTGT